MIYKILSLFYLHLFHPLPAVSLMGQLWKSGYFLASGFMSSSETQGQIKGARESLNRWKNLYETKKSKEWREEPLGTMSYETSSKRSPPLWLLIGARKTQVFLLFFASHFSARLDFPLSPLSAPRSPRMASCSCCYLKAIFSVSFLSSWSVWKYVVEDYFFFKYCLWSQRRCAPNHNFCLGQKSSLQTRAYKELQGVTGGYKGLRAVPRG